MVEWAATVVVIGGDKVVGIEGVGLFAGVEPTN